MIDTNENEMINDEILNQIENIVIEDDDDIETEVEEALLAEKEESFDVEAIYPSESDLEYPSMEMSSNEEVVQEEEILDEEQEDKLWQARTGLNFETLCGAIETIIFMSDKPVALAKIRNVIDEDLPLRVVHSSLERLQTEYENKHHGIRLQEVAEGYQFRTKATYSKYVQDLFKVNSLVLSPTALEVLAIIAYKQPVSKIEVEKIRGVDSSHIVRGLMDKRLVKSAGRSEEVGRPLLYATTNEFLEVFNLSTLTDLPPEHELDELSQQEIGKISDIKTIVNSGNDKKRFSFDEIDELDALSQKIKSIDSETEFTRSLKVEEKKRKTEEGNVIKSAFDLLEEHLDNKLVLDANLESVISEVFTAVTEPSIIRDLTAGPFNLPEMIDEEEEDDFQMIDLDTGEVIVEDSFLDDEEYSDEEQEKIDVSVDNIEEYDMLVDIEMTEEQVKEISEATGIEIQPADEPEAVEAAVELPEVPVVESTNPVEEQAIETAENLFNDNPNEISSLAAALDQAFANLTGESLDEVDLEEGNANVEEKVNDIDELTSHITEKAKDLDLDLGFLSDSPESDI